MYPVIDRTSFEGHGDGFGESSQQSLTELNKALSAGYATDPASQSNGGALRVESLDSTLKIVSFMQKHIQFYSDMPKSKAYNTVEEYNLLSKYGGRGGHFINEGGLPRTEDSKYQRRVQFIKFMGTTREITHPMLLVKPAHGNVVALETKNGAMWMLEHMERALFEGDSSIISQEFDGIEKQLIDGYADSDFAGDRLKDQSDDHVIDLRGKPLSEKTFSKSSEVLLRNYTYGSVMYLNPANHEDFDTQFFSKGRFNLVAGQNEVGFHTEKVRTAMGKVQMKPTVFLEIDQVAPTVANNDASPTAPASIGLAIVGGPSQFIAADAATYFYEVTAISASGESAPVAASSIAVVADDKVEITINRGAVSGNDLTQGYKVYRMRVEDKAAGALAKKYLVGKIASAGAVTIFNDSNADLPGLGKAYLGQMDESVLTLRELSPMLKFPLATVASSIRWMQLYYNTPIIFRPRSWVIIKNIGRLE
jgi:hypothetical protein